MEPESVPPMPPEPGPNDMPGPIWDVEKAIIKALDPAPFLKPFVREGFEAGFRVSQMIPFVNAVIPAINIVNQPPTWPALTRRLSAPGSDHRQRPHRDLAPGFGAVLRLRRGCGPHQPRVRGAGAQGVVLLTTWNLLDPFALLHNRGDSGLLLVAVDPDVGAIPECPGVILPPRPMPSPNHRRPGVESVPREPSRSHRNAEVIA